MIANQAGEYEVAIAHMSPVLQTNGVDDEVGLSFASPGDAALTLSTRSHQPVPPNR